MRARACTKCKEFIIIHHGNPKSMEIVKEFEADHRGHSVITVDINEIKARYNNVMYRYR
jgi:hypothetical protein